MLYFIKFYWTATRTLLVTYFYLLKYFGCHKILCLKIKFDTTNHSVRVSLELYLFVHVEFLIA